MPNHARPTLRIAAAALSLLTLAACKSEPEVALDPLKVERGRTLYTGCAACHDNRRRETLVGPHLVHVIDRRAGQVSGYDYSDALRRSRLTWTPENLRRFIEDPQGFLPGTNMAIDGLKPQDAAAITEYLLSRE